MTMRRQTRGALQIRSVAALGIIRKSIAEESVEPLPSALFARRPDGKAGRPVGMARQQFPVFQPVTRDLPCPSRDLRWRWTWRPRVTQSETGPGKRCEDLIGLALSGPDRLGLMQEDAAIAMAVRAFSPGSSLDAFLERPRPGRIIAGEMEGRGTGLAQRLGNDLVDRSLPQNQWHFETG